MFETLNDRGLRTSQADLVKNYLFGRAGPDRINQAAHFWSAMVATLESATNDPDITIDFIRHYLIVRHGHLREVEEFKTINGQVRSAPAAVEFASSLDALSTVYIATLNANHERWNASGERARKAIQVLRLFNIKPLRPVVLAVANNFPAGELVPALEFLAMLAVRLIVASSTRTSTVEVPLATTAKLVFDRSIDSASKLRESLAQVTPGDAQFHDAFAIMPVSNRRLARYYLRSLQGASDKERNAWWLPQDELDSINIDHVLPQRPEGNWPEFDDETHDAYVNRLGNQALMEATVNADLRSAGFAAKKPAYAKAFYTLTSQIAQADDWTPETIELRQRGLAKLAVDTWPIKASGKPPRAPRPKRSRDDEDVNEIAFRTVREATDI